MLKTFCAVGAMACFVAAGPGGAFAQSFTTTADAARATLAVEAGDELSMEALLATYPVIPAAVTTEDDTTTRALVISAGAIAGVVALNFYMGGLAYLPFTGVVAATPMATAESIVAISRVYAVTAAAAGGLAANWLYQRTAEPAGATPVTSRTR